MVQHIEAMGVSDSATLAAMRRVPREAFVLPRDIHRAYGDHPLAIRSGQTISQPFIVARMTELLRPKPGMRVLEIGTGSGYQAAVLAEIGCHVFSIEIDSILTATARHALGRVGYHDVAVLYGDGYRGWPEHAPFEAIIVTAAPPEIPAALVDQLAPRGRMVVPVGEVNEVQRLTLVEKDAAGSVRVLEGLPVRFVPMVRGRR